LKADVPVCLCVLMGNRTRPDDANAHFSSTLLRLC
jgi:hypothetical protein